LEFECAVRAPLVVMADIDPEDVLELSAAEDEQAVQAFRRRLPTQRSMWALAFGAAVSRITLIPSPWKTASKARLNFASRSWTRRRGRRPRSSRSISRLRACCAIQRPSGLLVEAMYSTRRLAMQRLVMGW
jgi:hypothetical protein